MDYKKNDPGSLMMLVSSMLIFGSIGIFRRFLPLSSAFLAFSRGLLGGLFILAFMIINGKTVNENAANKKAAAGKNVNENAVNKIIVDKKTVKQKPTVRQFVWLALTGALMGINWILLFEAFNYTTVAVATLCYYMQPTIVMLLSPFLFKEKPTVKNAVCAAVAVLGMILVSGVTGGAPPQTGNIRGILLGLAAAVFYSAVVIMNKKISGIDAYQKTAIQLLSAGIVMIPYLLLTGGFRSNSFSASSVILLLIVGLVHTGIAYVLYFGSMDGLRTQSVAIFSYVDPVSALFFSALFLREPLSISGIIGAVMIIGSAIISEVCTP